MNFLRLLPAILSALILGAHFFRAGQLPLTVLCVAALGLLLVKRAWAARTVQLLLVAGAMEWILTTVHLAHMRADAGMPWLRMAVMLGVVSLFTLGSALMFQGKALKQRYGIQDVVGGTVRGLE